MEGRPLSPPPHCGRPYAKVTNVLNKNPGLAQMKIIKNIHTGLYNEVLLEIGDLSSSDIVKMKFPPITSVEVERSFSRYKVVLRPNRPSSEFDNLKLHVIIQCNQDL